MIMFANGFSIFGFEIKYYGITIAFGMFLAVMLCCNLAKYRKLKSDDIFVIALYALPLAIVGARLYYVAFSSHSYTFAELFQIRNGGMAIYGGVIGGAIGVVLYCLIHKKNFILVADVAAVGLILGQAIGRWGNFFNQEAYGYQVTDPSLQWFPFSVFIEKESAWHLATFFYESIWNFAVFALLLTLIKRIKLPGVITSLYFIGYGIGRLFIEGLRTDSLYIAGTTIRVSQALSGVLIFVGIISLVIIYTTQRGKNNAQNNGKKNS